MNPHLLRAQLLLSQSRAADAEREVNLALAQNPEDPQAHALLACARVDAKRAAEALAPAQAAVGFAPDESYFHYVHAFVLHHLDKEKEALQAVNEALRLSPENEDNFALRSSIHLARRDWVAALADAEAALAIDPEHVTAANLRAMALVRLGRKEEATLTVDAALQRAPENAMSHANQGWTCLHRNDPRAAQEHFREALRLDPELEFARQGMLEALKARNPIYRGMLAYFLWMGGLSQRAQWMVILGCYFGTRFIVRTAAQSPELGWFLWPIAILAYAFVFLTWTASPMFNLLLRLNRFGRLVLSREERTASNWFGGTLLVALLAFGAAIAGAGLPALLGGIAAVVLSVCVAATWSREGRNRVILACATGALALVAIAGITLVALGDERGFILAPVFMLGFLGLQVLANVLQR